jgi:hypothetical protein
MSSLISASKYWIRKSEAWLLSRFVASQSRFGLRSASDDGIYPELALKAALNTRIFSTFRRHPDYTPILEHVSPRLGHQYLTIIQDKYGLTASEVCALISPLQALGMPRCVRLPDLPIPVSTTSLRYLKVALEIVDRFGARLGHIVEIGCGYGGQAVILSQVAKVDSYTFIDLWQVNLLIRRFIESTPGSFPYEITTLRDTGRSRSHWDLAISNYAFSELPLPLQTEYHNQILSQCHSGYLTMNSGEQGAFGSIANLSKSDLFNLFTGASCDPETPETMPENYVFTWGSSAHSR